MSASNDEWELSKENIQPIQQGRKHEVLKTALSLHPEDIILQQRQAYENELRTYTGDDPLSVWCNYINWAEQNFPKGGRDSHLEQLMHQCLSILKDKSQYYDDKRFIDIWLKFANFAPKSTEIYGYMYSLNIGCKSAIFFIAWSWELEQHGNAKKADQVLTEGIHRKAEPLDKLKVYFSEFEMRLTTKVMNQVANNDYEMENCRSAFAVLKPQKKKNLAPVTRIGTSEPTRSSMIIGRQQPLPRSNVPSTKVPFKIYNAENIPSSLPLQSDISAPFIIHSDSSKENDKKPSKWNKVKVKQIGSTARSMAPIDLGFKVHCDEAPQPASTPRSIPKISNILCSRKEGPKPPIALFEPPDPMKKPMYDKEKVYGGGEEFSLEEIRAAEWRKRKDAKEIEKQNNNKLLEEQERKLCEQQEQIKFLMQQVELLRNKHPSPVPETNVSRVKSVDSNLDGVVPIDMFTLRSDNMHREEYGSNVIQKEMLPESKFTASYNEAANMVRDLYNGSIMYPSDDLVSTRYREKSFQSNTSASSDKLQQLSNSSRSHNEFSDQCHLQADQQPLATNKASLPFMFYRDPTENIAQSNIITSFKSSDLECPPNIFSGNRANWENQNEDIENIPPKNYAQDTQKRELTGILEPSKNIMFVPLEQQQLDEDSDKDEDYCSENNNHPLQDETLIPPCNTEQFVAEAYLASTPRAQLKHEMIYNLPSCGAQQNEQNLLKDSVPLSNLNHVQITAEDMPCQNQLLKSDNRKGVKDQSTNPGVPMHLSVIMETSKECYKSSSSSGSSASVTKLSQFSQCYSHEKSNIQKHLSRVDFFKEPRSVIQGLEISAKKESAFKEVRPGYLNSIGSDSLKGTSEVQNKMETEPGVFQTHCSHIDPFDEALKAKILSSMDLPSDYCMNMQVFDSCFKGPKVGGKIKFGNDTFEILSLVTEGGYGKVYKAQNCSFQLHYNKDNFESIVALKACEEANDWEFSICKKLHNRLESIKSTPDVRLSVMEILAAHKYQNGIVLMSEFHNQGTLLDLVNNYKLQNSNIPEAITMYLTLELLHVVSKIHQCKIIHGDIKPDNVLVRNISNLNVLTLINQRTTVVQLIDFGRGIDLTAFKTGICFETVVEDKCIEMRENAPWTYQPDWYGLLCCIHALLFSEYMTVRKNPAGRWEIEKKFKRYWNQSIWPPLFDELLNIPSCYQEPNVEKFTSLIESKLKSNAKSFEMHFTSLLRFYDSKKL